MSIFLESYETSVQNEAASATQDFDLFHLSDRDKVNIRHIFQHQSGGKALLLVHPFYFLTAFRIDPYLFSKDLSSDLTTSEKWQNITNSDLFRNAIYPQGKATNLESYLVKMSKLLARTELPAIILAEETSQQAFTIKIIRQLGYKGIIVFYTTMSASPAPSEKTATYADLARHLDELSLDKIVFAGQNLWYPETGKYAKGLPKPKIIHTKDYSTDEYLDKCVGTLSFFLAGHFNTMGTEKEFHISSYVWPQIEPTDVK